MGSIVDVMINSFNGMSPVEQMDNDDDEMMIMIVMMTTAKDGMRSS